MAGLRVEATDGIAHVVLNRPEARNALSIQLCNELTAAIHQLDGDLGVRAVVLSGEGKVFCSGADFSAVSGPSGIDFLPSFQRMLDAVARCRAPVTAKIHGAALGGGLQLATACDFQIASDDARLGIPSARLGIVIDLENVERLVAQVGPAVARRVLMTARVFTGVEAAELGLVTEATSEESLNATVEAFARRIASLAPLSVQGAKKQIQGVVDRWHGRGAPDLEETVAELVLQAYNSSDLQEGLAAMAEKREPRFNGV